MYLLITSCTQNLEKKIDETNTLVQILTESIGEAKETNTAPRFKIVQSIIAARGTFKLDSFNGDVFQLVVDKDKNESWQLLDKTGYSYNNTQVQGRVNYDIFLSTIGMRFTYIINVNTGVTWQLFQDTNTKENFFGLIE